MIDKVSSGRFCRDAGDKTKLNWFLYEYANVLFDKIAESPKLAKYRKTHSGPQIADFCVYYSKRLKKSMHDVYAKGKEGVALDARYVYEFYPKNTRAQTDALLAPIKGAWREHLEICSACPNQCAAEPHELMADLFDGLKENGPPE
jgi:hypothetical protein